MLVLSIGILVNLDRNKSNFAVISCHYHSVSTSKFPYLRWKACINIFKHAFKFSNFLLVRIPRVPSKCPIATQEQILKSCLFFTLAEEIQDRDIQ